MRSSLPRLLKKCGNAGIPRRGARAKSGQRGYILVAVSLGLVFLLGAGGLAIDIGRMYIAKSETQAFVDSAAFAATLQLDDSPGGITQAQTAVSNNPKRW